MGVLELFENGKSLKMSGLEEALEIAQGLYNLYQAGKSAYDTGAAITRDPGFRNIRKGGFSLPLDFDSAESGMTRDIGVKLHSQASATLRKRVKAAIKKEQLSRYVPVAVAAPGYSRVAGFYGRFGHEQGKMTELKFFDTDLGFNFDLTGEVVATGQLNLIPQGTTESARIGRKVKIHSIQIRGVLKGVPVSAGTFADVTYMILVQDTQCNGAAAGVQDVMTGVSFEKAMINIANSGRFRILKRWVHHHTAASGVTGAKNDTAVALEYWKKCNIEINFSSTTGAIGEIKSNNIFLMAGSTISDDKVSFAGTCRLRFSD